MLPRLSAALHRTAPLTWRERILWLVIAILLLHWPFLSHIHKSLNKQHGDWLSIYHIARHSVQTGELRAEGTEDLVISERYPPIARSLLMPLALPPKAVSAVLSFVLFASLYGWCAVRLSDLFLRPSPAGRWLGSAITLGLVSPYIWADLAACNLTSVLLWSVTAAFALAQSGKPIRAGVALSVGISLKMIPAICLLYFISRRQWRVLWGAVIGIVVLGLLPSLVIFGPKKLWDYHGYWYREEFSKFTPMATIDQPVECLYQNQAVVRTMIRLFTHTNAGHSADPFYIQIAEPPRWVLKAGYVAIMGASVGLLLWVLWSHRHDSSPLVIGGCYALCVGAMLWLSPWVASYYFSLAMWPATALAAVILGPAAARDESLGRLSRASAFRRDRTPVIARFALATWLLLIPTLASQSLRALGASMWGVLVLLVAVARILPRHETLEDVNAK